MLFCPQDGRYNVKRHCDTMRRSIAYGGRGFRFDHCSSSTRRYSSMTVSEVIRTKRAVRQFSDEPLSEEAIRTILMAGRRAQSSKNTQPWHFIAIRDQATLRQPICNWPPGTWASVLASPQCGSRRRSGRSWMFPKIFTLMSQSPLAILSPATSSLPLQIQTGASRSMRWFSGNVGADEPAVLASQHGPS